MSAPEEPPAASGPTTGCCRPELLRRLPPGRRGLRACLPGADAAELDAWCAAVRLAHRAGDATLAVLRAVVSPSARCVARGALVADCERLLGTLGVADAAALRALPPAALLDGWACTLFRHAAAVPSPKRWDALARTVLVPLGGGDPAALSPRVQRRRVRRAQLAAVVALRAGATGCSEAQWRAVAALLEGLPLAVYPWAGLAAVCALAPRFPAAAELAAAWGPLDHAELAAALGTTTVPHLVGAAKRQPGLDPEGRFSSHLWRVRRATLAPLDGALYAFPLDLPLALQRYALPAADARWFVELAVAVAERQALHAVADPARARAAIGAVLAHAVRTLYDRAPPVPLGGFLAPPLTRERLVDLCAHVEAASQRRAREAAYAVLPEAAARWPMFRLVQGALRAGVFAPAVPAAPPLRRLDLVRAMRRLEARDGARWQADVPPRPVREEAGLRLTQGDVERLLRAAADGPPRARVVLLLLYTTGLRAGAVARLQCGDVEGRAVWTVTEKFGRVRRVRPCAELRAAMEAYLASSPPPGTTYLFGHPLRPRTVPRHAAQQALRVLCRRAGLERRVYPHQFRRHIVTLFLQHRNSLDQAAKFLGHASVATTYRHYWWVDAAELAADLPFFGSGGDGGSALEFEQTRRRELEAEVARLRAQLRVTGTP